MTDQVERLRTALADRYRVEHELGSGGMATVYLARDLKLNRKVAVKVLRPDLAATLGPERFLREIEVAAKLHHPHILPLHDSGEVDGFLYYVMPYEEGESLREKLAKEGELPVMEAVRILRDVVDALAHAHEHRVVHRDIKPDNVMVSGRHALVTDFGVAKAVIDATGRQQLTTAGVALGTPAYMAPEQAVADPHIDHRADIYAVGALAYELLTGQPPFTGTTPQMVLSAHVTEAPEPVTKYREAVPPALAQLVMRCLEKKPADRWQSAEELLSQLEALATPSGGITPTQGVVRTPPLSRKRLYAAGAALLGVILVTAFATSRFVKVGGSGTLIGQNVLAEHDLILVAEFENRTADSLLGATVTDAIRVELQQSPVVAVLGQQSMWDGMRRMGLEPGAELPGDQVRELAERENVKAYVTGDIGRLGAGYQLTARVVATTGGDEALTVRTTAPDDAGLIGAVEDLGRQLRRDIGESLRTVRAAPPLARVTTASLPALRAHMAGLRAENDGDRRRAIALLQEAVSLDTAFAAAWSSLAAIYLNQNRYDLALDAQSRAYQFRDRLTELERLRITGGYHLQRGEFTQAEAAYLRLSELQPDIGPPAAYAELLLQSDRLAEAEAISLQAIEGQPLAAVPYWNAVEAQVAQGRFDAADSTLAVMARHLPGHQWLGNLRSRMNFAERDFDKAEAFWDSVEAGGFDGPPGLLESQRCAIAGYRGRLAEMEKCLSRGGPQGFWMRFAAFRFTGDTAAFGRQIDIDALLAARGVPSVALGQVIAALAEIGHMSDARRVMDMWRERYGPDDLGYRVYIGLAAGAIALAEGNPDSAASAFLAYNRSGYLGAEHVYNRGLPEAANAMDLAGHPDSAIALYERALASPSVFGNLYELTWYPLALRRLGELHESLGHRDEAIDYYQRFIELWDEADPELQPQVQAARERLTGLVGERR